MSIWWWILTLAVAALNVLWGYGLTKKQDAIAALANIMREQRRKIIFLEAEVNRLDHYCECLDIRNDTMDTRVRVLEEVQEEKAEEEK